VLGLVGFGTWCNFLFIWERSDLWGAGVEWAPVGQCACIVQGDGKGGGSVFSSGCCIGFGHFA
jgi:hypothetical protein